MSTPTKKAWAVISGPYDDSDAVKNVPAELRSSHRASSLRRNQRPVLRVANVDPLKGDEEVVDVPVDVRPSVKHSAWANLDLPKPSSGSSSPRGRARC